MGLESINVSSSKIKEEPYKPEICNNQDGSPIDIDGVEFLGSSSDFDTKPQQTDKNGSCTDRFGDCDGSQSMNLDACCLAEMIGSMRMLFDTETRGENSVDQKATSDTIYSDPHEMPIDDGDLVSHQSKSKDLENPPNTVASKESILSQTALRVLFGRRNKLILQQRNIEDEIALYNKRIQSLLNGGKDDLVVKIESILEGCDDMCLRSLSQERSLHLENHCSPQSIKMMRLSEAVLNKQNSCQARCGVGFFMLILFLFVEQELDDISYENNWILPTYHISSSDGGFRAEVTVKGKDFECSSSGDLCFSPQEARQSAATQILAKLRRMASESK
ncbi:hypothetical protein Patl1_26335 [Pistacia atlantica]|uniref:Uncharacterized protein n=1 Tax=Pistacia atlantica TaxID=434234 RepID=A0ACC1B547_9ROSI|nr:hypothetical protein Patl1_26335 [Pistacia atlantica]